MIVRELQVIYVLYLCVSIDSLSFCDLYFSDFISFSHQRFAMVYCSLTCVCTRTFAFYFLYANRSMKFASQLDLLDFILLSR